MGVFIIITPDHRLDPGDTWRVWVSQWSGMLLSPISVLRLSPLSEFVLTWPNVGPSITSVEAGDWLRGPWTGALCRSYWLVSTTGVGWADWVNFDSVELDAGHTMVTHTNTLIITHLTASSLTQLFASELICGDISGDHDSSLSIPALPGTPAYTYTGYNTFTLALYQGARKQSQEVNHWLVRIAGCNQWIISSYISLNWWAKAPDTMMCIVHEILYFMKHWLAD